MRELEGTLVSVDLSGFTALSERLQAKGRAGAEELTLAVSGVFQGLIGITERHDGDVLKFRGDALLLFFDGEDHERRACYAAADMQWLIGTTGEMMSSVGPVTLRMSTGVYTGTCHFFLVEGTHRELVIAGPAATATIELEDGRRGRERSCSASGRRRRSSRAGWARREETAGSSSSFRSGRSRSARSRRPPSCRTRSSCTYPSRCARTCCSRPARRSTARSPPRSSSSRASTS